METDEVRDPAALAELRARLEAGRIASRLNQTALARKAGLGRTTVSRALSQSAPGPSADTVGALGRVLHLDVPALLGLLDAACGRGPAAVADAGRPGQAIQLWDPHDLEVHPAAEAPAAGSSPGAARDRNPGARGGALPAYVRRPHDELLVELVASAEDGNNAMAVLVGSSSTGKTRACWEAVQPLAAAGWRLWHPFEPTRADAALTSMRRVAPRTVVWLNDAQHYFGGENGERIAAAVHGLLTDASRSPVLIVGTLWPEVADTYMTPPRSGEPDPHSQVRGLLAGRLIALPDSFDGTAIKEAEAFAAAGDRQLAHALKHSDNGRLTQFLAGAPELLRRYSTASPPVRAMLEVAMDARRLGAGVHLPARFIEQAAEDYLSDEEYDDLADNWPDQAFTDVTRPVQGRLAPLRRVRPRTAQNTPAEEAAPVPSYRLADYLEQHGRRRRARLCPPESFWQAAHDHLSPEELTSLAEAARSRHRFQWAEQLAQQASGSGNANVLVRIAEIRRTEGALNEADRLIQRAADTGNTTALISLAIARENAGRREEAEQLAQRAAEGGDSKGLGQLAEMRESHRDPKGAEELALRAVSLGNTSPLIRLAEARELAGAHQSAERLCQLAANAGDATGLVRVAAIRETLGARKGAQKLYQLAARVGNASALVRLAVQREMAGDRTGAEQLAWQAANAGQSFALVRIAEMREAAGAQEAAEKLARQAIEAGHRFALVRIATIRQVAGDHKGAERLYRQAAESGNPSATARLTEMAEAAGEPEAAERLALHAAKSGNPSALARLADQREAAGDPRSAEKLALLAAEAGDTSALARMAEMRELTRDTEGAERLARQAAAAGNPSALMRLADIREAAGDSNGAEKLARLAADAGDIHALARVALMRAMAGDTRQAEQLARLAADAGNPSALAQLAERKAAAARNDSRPMLHGPDSDASAVPVAR
ncbi:transcriptional regulator [Streptomyces sp. NPDC005303]|uniref:transcriptional regulator n=1 Tax=Streptomyces sp. NPDC005303 TaxID=3155713 RepID=UPI0033B585EF